jgi:nucleoid-associated protein YgaU
VRVDPAGTTVMAGRASPGSEVAVTSDGRTIGKTTADTRGEWVIIPQEKIGPGTHEIDVAARLPGGDWRDSEAQVVLVVPEVGKNVAGQASEQPGQPLALLLSKESMGSMVLQSPESGAGPGAPTTAIAPEGIASGGLVLESVDYDDSGAVTIGGRADPGSEVRIYVDNRLIGGAVSDDAERWRVTPDEPLEPGLHKLRVDLLAASGTVMARVESPFLRAEAMALPSDVNVVVQPGNSLWRIARRTYGEGLRYTVIYQANKSQITDPDLIYPGQVFEIPPLTESDAP